MSEAAERIVTTTCTSHCGGSCLLKLHVQDGVVTRIETDDGEEPQLRACLRGRAYRQRVYAPDRLLHPMKRVGPRGSGRLARISWDEALDTVAGQIKRVRGTYGNGSIISVMMAGDVGSLNTTAQMSRLLNLAGGFTMTWGTTSFQAGLYAQQICYGTISTGNTRDDLPNSKLILMWGWNPASTITGVNTNYFLIKAREAGARIVAVDPRYTASAATFADEWLPIRPGTDSAVLLAMAHVMIGESLQDQAFLDRYTVGFDRFRDHVAGLDDGIPKTPQWAEAIAGVPAASIVRLARDYATIRPAAFMAGIAPGRTANGEHYHRIAITLAAMTGNVGIHGGGSAGRAWESRMGGYPYKMDGHAYLGARSGNAVDDQGPRRPKGSPAGYKASRVHLCDVPDFILRGKEGGYPADGRLVAVVNCSYVNAMPNVNKIIHALKSDRLEFLFVLEQFMTPTVKYADIVFPTNTFFERNDFTRGVGLLFYGDQPQAIESLGGSKSHYEIASLLAGRLGLSSAYQKSEQEWLSEMLDQSEVPDREEFKQEGVYRLPRAEPYVGLEKQIADPEHNPFPTASGKIEIYSQRLADLANPALPPVPTYMAAREGWGDPLCAQYPLQMISTHFKRRANNQFDNIPWLRELEPHALMINTADAAARGILNGDPVRVFNDRGTIVIPALVTERIMPGVVDVPQGAWYDPDPDGVDRGGCSNVLTNEAYSAGGTIAYNSALVEVALDRPHPPPRPAGQVDPVTRRSRPYGRDPVARGS